MKLTEYIKKQQHRKGIKEPKERPKKRSGKFKDIQPCKLKGKRFRDWFDAGMP